MWLVDKNGVTLNEPNHFLSDAMDAVRYAVAQMYKASDSNLKSYNTRYKKYIDSLGK